jgi:hypothetical protein
LLLKGNRDENNSQITLQIGLEHLKWTT